MLLPLMFVALVAQRPCPQDRHPKTIEALAKIAQEALVTRRDSALDALLFDACDRAGGSELASYESLFRESWDEDSMKWAQSTLLDSARDMSLWTPTLRFGAPEEHVRRKETRIEVPIEGYPLALVIPVERIASGYVLADYATIGIDDQALAAEHAALLQGDVEAAALGDGKGYAERVRHQAGYTEVEALVRQGLATRLMQPIGDALPRRICDIAELDVAYGSETADETRALLEDDGAKWRGFFNARLKHAERFGIDPAKLVSRRGKDELERMMSANDVAMRRAFAGVAAADSEYSAVMDRVLAKLHKAIGPLPRALWLLVGAAAPNPPTRFDEGEGWPVVTRSSTPTPVPPPVASQGLESWTTVLGPYPNLSDCRVVRAELTERIGLIAPAEQGRFLTTWREIRWLLRATEASKDHHVDFSHAAEKLCEVLQQQLPQPAAEPPWDGPTTRLAFGLGVTGDTVFQLKEGALRWGKPGKVPHLVLIGSLNGKIDRTLVKNLAALALDGKIALELRPARGEAEQLQCAFEDDPARLLTAIGNKDAKLSEWFDEAAIDACVASGRHVPRIARANAELLRQGLTRPRMLLDGHIWENEPKDVPNAIFVVSRTLSGR